MYLFRSGLFDVNSFHNDDDEKKKLRKTNSENENEN